MNINKLDTVLGNPVFGARLVTSKGEIKSLYNQLSKSAEDKKLMDSIIKAFENHPQEILFRTSVVNKPGFWGARGAISTRYTKFIDTEPANNNRTNPIKNILRRILDPENKEIFNKLVGGKHDEIYDSWWNENIAPIWDKISLRFREKTFFNGNYDSEFNKDFREQRERTWQRIFSNNEG